MNVPGGSATGPFVFAALNHGPFALGEKCESLSFKCLGQLEKFRGFDFCVRLAKIPVILFHLSY